MLEHRHKEERPWGSFDRLTLNESTTVKIITVRPNETLSLQRHTSRSEWWKVLSGSGTFVVDDKTITVAIEDECHIPQRSVHRVIAGDSGLVFLEIAFGFFDENDIERLDDKYGRV